MDNWTCNAALYRKLNSVKMSKVHTNKKKSMEYFDDKYFYALLHTMLDGNDGPNPQ